MTNLPQINAKLKPILHTFQESINGETQLLVNARELHAFLEGKQECAHWIGKRIEKYGFVEGSDYLIDKIIIQLPSGTKYKTDYHLSLDMAKELSMVQRNAKGKQARQYFIACEKALIGDVGQLHALTAQNQVLKDELLKVNNDYKALQVMHDGGLENWQMGLAVGLAQSTVSKKLAKMQKLGLIGERYEMADNKGQLTLGIQRLNNAQSALYQLELVQEMAMSFDSQKFPIQEYAYIVDTFVKTIKDNLESITATK